MPGAVHALLVGIDAYPDPVPRLLGCRRDIAALEALLRLRLDDRPLHLTTLTDAEATRDAVVAAFREQLGKAGPDDVALFAYAGHGSQEPTPKELWDGEPDHLDETLVLVDSRRPGGWDLADKELALLLHEVARTAGHVLVLLDSCHAGSGTRGDDGEVVRVRYTSADVRDRPASSYLPGAVELARTGPAARSTEASGWPGAGRHVLLAACREDQTSKECRGPLALGGGVRGALSVALERALQGEGAGLTYRELHRWVAADVRNRVPDQDPQLETADGADLDQPFLGGAVRRVPATFTATYDPAAGWVLDGGVVHGVVAPRGTETTHLVLLDPAADLGQRRTDDVLAEASVTSVSPGGATIALVSEDKVQRSRSYPALVTAVPLARVPVHLSGDDAAVAAVRERLPSAVGRAFVPVDDPSEAQLLVEARPDEVRIVRPAATTQVPVVVRTHEGVDAAIAVLAQVARWITLALLRNPTTALAPDAVRVELVGPGGAAPEAGRLVVDYAADAPPPVEVRLTSTADRPLWCALLDLTETYGVYADAFAAGAVRLEAGQTTSVMLTGQIPDGLWAKGVTESSDVLKVVVSTEPLDARLLGQPDLEVADARPADVVRGDVVPETTLDALMQRVVTRGAPAAPAGQKLADWSAFELTVTVRRPRA